jgi:hypothetical protein
MADDDLAFDILNRLEFFEEKDTLKLPELFDSLFATLLPEAQAKEIEILVESNYTGLKLGDMFEEADSKNPRSIRHEGVRQGDRATQTLAEYIRIENGRRE